MIRAPYRQERQAHQALAESSAAGMPCAALARTRAHVSKMRTGRQASEAPKAGGGGAMFNYCPWALAAMPQSIQVYIFDTGRSAAQVLDACKKRVDKDKKAVGHPRMLEVGRTGGNITGLLDVQVSDDVLRCWFAVRPKDSRLVLMGASQGRSKAADFLARTIEGESRKNMVFVRQISVKQMLRLFDSITKQDRGNHIGKLVLNFEPEFGREYAQETYTLIAYSFVQNRCASDHKDFKSLCKDAKRMEMRLQIRKCEGVVPDPDGLKHHTMVVKPNCTFRMYHEISPKDWLAFCDAMLGFLNEVNN